MRTMDPRYFGAVNRRRQIGGIGLRPALFRACWRNGSLFDHPSLVVKLPIYVRNDADIG
jgi:hypothetical protein